MKTLYETNGIQLNQEGLKAQKQIETSIERFYIYWLDRGYSPSEIRELMFNQIFTTTTFVNALRS